MNILYHHRTQGRRVERVHILGVTQGLRQLGHTVTIVSPPGVEIEQPGADSQHQIPGTAAGEKQRWGWISKRLPQVCFEGLELAYNAVGRRRLDRLVQHGGWDCIYERYALNTWAGAAAAASAQVPLILEINDATGIQRERSHRLLRIAAAIERRVWARATFLVTISSAFANILYSRGVPADKTVVLPNAVDPAQFRARPEDSAEIRRRLGAEQGVVVGFAGSFARWHGVNKLIEQLPQLVAGRPDVKIVLIGDGKCRKEAEAQVTSAGLLPQVKFTGWIPHCELPAYLGAMDIGIIPDSNDYGSPMKLFEYMAMGVVPVVPDYPPMRDVLVHGHHGLLFPRGDWGAMRQAIHRLADDTELRRGIGEAARAKALKEHTWEANARVIEALITEAKGRING